MIRLLLAAVAATGFYVPDLPPDAVRYAPATHTQSVDRMQDFGGPLRPRTIAVPIAAMSNTDWHQSGGIRGLKGVTSEKYSLRAGKSWWTPLPVTNSYGNTQHERGIVRVYDDGSRFDDVLWYKGRVFEHRTRTKVDGKWTNTVTYRDESAAPPGYKPVKLAECATCHNKAGTGGYSEGLVPGGDTVLSDPLDWSVVPDYARRR